VELAKQKTMRAKSTRQARAITILLAIAVCGALQVRAQSNLPTEMKRQTKHLVQPMIPELAKKLNLTGTVRIEVTIAENGTVKRSRVLGGHPLLAMEAERAALKSTFEPGPRETTEVIEFKF
jgi:TonB family protein